MEYNILTDIKNLRNEILDLEQNKKFISTNIPLLLSEIIERELEYRAILNTKPSDLEKQNLEKEIDKYNNQSDYFYKWLCYYQDKCRILEKDKLDKNIQSKF